MVESARQKKKISPPCTAILPFLASLATITIPRAGFLFFKRISAGPKVAPEKRNFPIRLVRLSLKGDLLQGGRDERKKIF